MTAYQCVALGVACGFVLMAVRCATQRQAEPLIYSALATRDLDCDGIPDVISLRSEHLAPGSYNRWRCPGEWWQTLTVTRGGSNGAEVMHAESWCAPGPIRRAGWLRDGSFLVHDGGGAWTFDLQGDSCGLSPTVAH